MDAARIYSIIKVAKLYYEMKMSQEEIAHMEGISKSTVSRLLQKGLDMGIVRVSIDYPMESVVSLGDQIKQCYGLKEVFIAPVMIDDEKLVLRDVCRALADRLDKYIKNDDVVGVSWGNTMNCLAAVMKKICVSGVKVVQLNGGVPRHTLPTGATKIVDSLARCCDGEGYLFPVPAIVDTKLIADVIKHDSQVNHVLNLAKESVTTIFSIGAVTKNSILYQAGYFKEEEYQRLQSLAVGDICSRFFDPDGRLADPAMDSRVVGITLEELKAKKNKIAVASGVRKVASIVGALNGKYVDVLYTDEKTAQAILQRFYSSYNQKFHSPALATL